MSEWEWEWSLEDYPTSLPVDRSIERLRFADDLDHRMDQLDPDLQAVAREVAMEL